MAGAGYKLFATGDVLTAAQVNTYLQEQVVMVFANAAARTTALSGVLAEGMVTYLKDTDALEIYSGSAWVGYGSGDITGITTGATSGLTGGVTSGTADLKFNTTAKGGLLVGTGSGTVSELSVGSNTQVLTADSTTATGLKWATAASGGKVLQVVMGSTSTTASNSTTTYADTNLTASITPSLSTSKVLVIVSQCGVFRSNGNSNNALLLQLQRSGSSIAQISNEGMQTDTALRQGDFTYNIAYLDSPATTSATTYKTQFKNKNASASVQVQVANELSTIILMEIGV